MITDYQDIYTILMKKKTEYKATINGVKLIFITIYRKTCLLACFLTIAYHSFYLYIFDSPYLFTLKIMIWIMWMIEITGFILDKKYPSIYPKRLVMKINPKVRESYNFIENSFYICLLIYVYLPKVYLWPNYLMMILSGLFIGYRIAITTNRYSNRLKSN